MSDDIVINRTILLDSSQRNLASSTSVSDFKMNLPNSLQIRKGDIFRLEHISIPITWWTIDPSTVLEFEEDNGPLNFTIAPGYYNNTTFAQFLQTRLNQLGAFTYTVTVDPVTQRLTITSSADFALGGIGNPSLGNWTQFGFTNVSLHNQTAVSHTAELPLLLDRYRFVYINVNGIGSANDMNNSGTFIIPITENQLSVIDFRTKDSFYQHVKFESDTGVLSIRLTDIQNNTIDLNGRDWYIILKKMSI